MNLELILGLEVHLHLKLETKMFCRCDSNIYGAQANTYTCPVCLGLPGALPYPNEKAIRYTQLLGLALGCTLTEFSKFDRKNYFYPDLPKGYQISQYDQPLCQSGSMEVLGKKINIRRVHIEEDTGKSIHEGAETLLDFNKSGMALVEIVTEPDFRSAEEAVEFSKMIQRIARYLGIADCDMEKGQLRLEANISMRKVGEDTLPPYRVEVKNINSFRFLEKAVNYEIKRQSEIIQKGETPIQENRGWDDVKHVTLAQREKEEAYDYRYFPEPDIPPMKFEMDYITNLKSQIPELPTEKLIRLIASYKINKEVAFVICDDINLANKFEELAKEIEPKSAANILVNKIEYRTLPVNEIILKVKEAKDFIDESSLKEAVQSTLKENLQIVDTIKVGKKEAIMYLVGVVMKRTGGKADPSVAKKLLEEEIYGI